MSPPLVTMYVDRGEREVRVEVEAGDHRAKVLSVIEGDVETDAAPGTRLELTEKERQRAIDQAVMEVAP